MSKKHKRHKKHKLHAERPTPPPPAPGYWQTVFAPISRNPVLTGAAIGAVAALTFVGMIGRARADRIGVKTLPMKRITSMAPRGEDIIPPAGESSF